MRRVTGLLLLSATLVGCHIGEVTNASDDIGPKVRFVLQDINGYALPYTPGDTLTNPHALITDELLFDSVGGVEEISTIRTRGPNSTTISVRHEPGRFSITPPYITILWAHAGVVTYAFRHDSLWVPVAAVKELWTYTLDRSSDTTLVHGASAAKMAALQELLGGGKR